MLNLHVPNNFSIKKNCLMPKYKKENFARNFTIYQLLHKKKYYFFCLTLLIYLIYCMYQKKKKNNTKIIYNCKFASHNLRIFFLCYFTFVFRFKIIKFQNYLANIWSMIWFMLTTFYLINYD